MGIDKNNLILLDAQGLLVNTIRRHLKCSVPGSNVLLIPIRLSRAQNISIQNEV